MYDELSTNALLLLNHTGTDTSPPVTSSGGRMMVVLNHIGFTASRYIGFEAEYAPVSANMHIISNILMKTYISQETKSSYGW